MKYSGMRVVLMVWAVALAACSGNKDNSATADFTRIDSLTDTYLMLQDTMLQSWNVMIWDENEKIGAMHDLLHELQSVHLNKEQLVALEQRLDQLQRIRFTQKNMSNPHVVEEYDFSSNSLISELISLAENNPAFSSDKKLQSIVDRIRTADQRVNVYRAEYDAAAADFNLFIEKNKDHLKEIDASANPQKRPLFQMASQ